ncbi:MAG: hypothetical protein PHX21_06225 [bacterium]|nr:hypothetical protein [bacterium]
MKILYLGQVTPHNFHEQNTIFMFLKYGHKVCIVNTHPSYFTDEITGIGKLSICNLYEYGNPYAGKFGSLRMILNNFGILKCFKQERKKLRKFVELMTPDVIYCFFGVGILTEMKMLIDMNLGIPLIHDIVCYPGSLTGR